MHAHPGQVYRPTRAAGTAAVLLTAVTSGAAVALLSRYDPTLQTIGVLLLGGGPVALLLFVARPHMALAAYLAIIPLLLPWPVAAGLNAGEAFTVLALMLGLFSLWGVGSRVRDSLRSLSAIVIPFVAMALVSTVSLLVNGIASAQEIVSALFKVLAFGLVALLVHVHANTPEKARTLLLACVAGAIACAVYTVIAYVLGWSYSEYYDWNRALGTFENWNQLGGFMALMSMPTLGLALVSRSTGARAFFFAGSVLQLAALAMSLTLGSILALLIAGVFALVFLLRVSRRRFAAAAALFVVAIAALFATSEPLREKALIVDQRVLDRLNTYAVGVRMFSDRIWFGFGSEQQVIDQALFGEADYGLTIFGRTEAVPHNAFLRLGVEKGIFGVLAFTVLIVGSIRILFRNWREQRLGREGLFYAALVTGIVAFLVQNLTNDLIMHARTGVIFFALIAIADRMRQQRWA